MTAGTLVLTNNSDVATGTGTTFTTDLVAGDFVVVTVGGITYTLPVKSVVSDTSLTLISKYTGPTQAGAAWTAVPRATQNQVTAALVAQATEALRGQNYDKANWQAVFSASGDITVLLPDGSTFTGPSWKKITDMLTAIDPVAMQALADQVNADALQVAADRLDVDSKSQQAHADAQTATAAAGTATTAAGTATTANSAAQQAKTDAETAKAGAEAAKTQAEAAAAGVPSMASIDTHFQQSGVSAPLIATNLDSVTISVATVVNFSYAAGATNAPDAASGTGRQYTVGTVISQLVVSDIANTWRRSKTGSAAWSGWVKTGFNDNDLTANPWVNLSLQNGWTVQSGTRAAYRKLFGKMDIDLHITGGSFSNGVILATLPTGSRPSVTQSGLLIASGTWNNSYPPRMFIGSDGNISMWGLINNGQLDAAVTINL